MAVSTPAPVSASAAAESTLNMLKEATAEGIKAGVASELSERLVSMLEDKFGDNYPIFFKLPIGRRVLSYVLPVALYFLASAFPERIPVSPEACKKAARYAVLGHSVKVVAPLFDMLTPIWKELAAFSTTLSDNVTDFSKKGV